MPKDNGPTRSDHEDEACDVIINTCLDVSPISPHWFDDKAETCNSPTNKSMRIHTRRN